jgi:hypothetical protein
MARNLEKNRSTPGKTGSNPVSARVPRSARTPAAERWVKMAAAMTYSLDQLRMLDPFLKSLSFQEREASLGGNHFVIIPIGEAEALRSKLALIAFKLRIGLKAR